MAKAKETNAPAGKPATSGKGSITQMFILILKFLLAVILLPIVMGMTYAVQGELATFEPAARDILMIGMVSYVILRFFVYDFFAIYTFGQGMVTMVFQFLKPLVSAAPYVLPIYTLMTIVIYGVLKIIGVAGEWQELFLFLCAFTFTMHIVLTAQDLYAKDSTAGKPNYFFGMALVYIVDVFLMALLMSLAVKEFSFPHFFQMLTKTSWGIYLAVFNQLFKP
jgi:hypothetical protein